jgi:hypothetical protein
VRGDAMTKPPVTLLRNLSLLVLGYLFTWGGAYVLTLLSRGDRPSFRECCDYLILAWSFQAGELPGFIWLLSLVGFALLVSAWVFLELRRRNHSQVGDLARTQTLKGDQSPTQPAMRASQPKEVCNLAQGLPGYGENDVGVSFQNGTLRLEIRFDAKDRTSELQHTVVFAQVCSYRVSSLPGAAVGAISYEGVFPALTGSLLEFQASEAADLWRAHFSRAPRVVRHFLAVFSASNLLIEVFAADCELKAAVG